MFDIGFGELTLIMLVALIVIGPERLPGVARTIGLWFGRLRRFVAGVKSDIEREIAADELRRTLAEQARIPELEELVPEPPAEKKDTGKTAAPKTTPDDHDRSPDHS